MRADAPCFLRLPPAAAGRRVLRLHAPLPRPSARSRPLHSTFRRRPHAAWMLSLLLHGGCVGAVWTVPPAHKAPDSPFADLHAVTYMGFRPRPIPSGPTPAEAPPPAVETPLPEPAPPVPVARGAPPEMVPPDAVVLTPPPPEQSLPPPDPKPPPAAMVPPPTPPAAGITPAGDEGRADAVARLQAAIRRYLRYPEIARRHGEEGRIEIVLRIDRMGGLLDVRIEPAEASPRFVRAATQAVRRAQPLPSVPEGDYRIPVRFLLRDARE